MDVSRIALRDNDSRRLTPTNEEEERDVNESMREGEDGDE